MANGDDQGHKERIQKIRLLDGNLAKRRKNANCPPWEPQEDGCQLGPTESQDDEGQNHDNQIVGLIHHSHTNRCMEYPSQKDLSLNNQSLVE